MLFSHSLINATAIDVIEHKNSFIFLQSCWHLLLMTPFSRLHRDVVAATHEDVQPSVDVLHWIQEPDRNEISQSLLIHHQRMRQLTLMFELADKCEKEPHTDSNRITALPLLQ